MPRRRRLDYPGAWHHVVNRGIAKRPLFESVRDVRYFLACLARQVRMGRIEVHAYAILTTHFHLLVRSPGAELSAAMQQCQDAYARWFNRGRLRDGPLFRGRFTNRIIEDDAYWDSVLRYIDWNPVSAGLTSIPWEFPFGSAYHYGREGRAPPWLERGEVQAWVNGRTGAESDPREYRRFCAAQLSEGRQWVVSRRLSMGSTAEGQWVESILSRATSVDRSWMAFKAALADGGTVGHPLVSPESVAAAMNGRALTGGESVIEAGGWSGPWRETLFAGSLRSGSSESIEAIASRLGLKFATAQRRVALFRRAVATSDPFLREAASVLGEAWAMDGKPRGAPDSAQGRLPGE